MDGENFTGSFTTEGVSMLQERLREKLRELMEDPTDESLMDYVIVLLRNGRCKDDAIKELDVFLGDQSTPFVSWLWEHLSINSHLYVNEEAPSPSSISSSANDNGRKRDLSKKLISSSYDSTDKMEADTASRKEGRRDWHKRGQQEMFPLRNVVTHILHGEERNKQSSSSLKQCDSSSKTRDIKKRLREDDEQQPQKKVNKQSAVFGSVLQSSSVDIKVGSMHIVIKPFSSIHALKKSPYTHLPTSSAMYFDQRGGVFLNVSHRLLQSAVRDAVKPMPQAQRTSNLSEPASKRLHSVVLTSPKEKNPDASADVRAQRKRSTLNASGSLIAIKAAAEAAESTSKPRNYKSVFDRLATRKPDFEKRLVERENVEFDRFEASKNYDLDRDDEMAEFDGQKEMTQQSTFAVDSLDDGFVKEMSPKQDPRYVASFDESMDLSVNAETCEGPSPHKTSNDIKKMVAPFSREKESTNTSVMPKVEECCTPDIKEENVDAPKELQKISIQVPASYATSHPLDDVDSRTVFVSNVNFGATKDALSRHFNKFGAVLKVVIINDPTTGQPTGSACVEFLNKESAELALSVNGTSFMSRIVKVVKRNSHEAAQFLGWPRGGRVGSSFGMYPRGAAFRGRPPIKPGTRSLQWKRGTSSVASTNTDAN